MKKKPKYTVGGRTRKDTVKLIAGWVAVALLAVLLVSVLMLNKSAEAKQAAEMHSMYEELYEAQDQVFESSIYNECLPLCEI